MQNWGVRIAIIYGSFVLGILTMVSMAMNQKIDLVSEDYYAKELKFQEQINHTENALNIPIASSVNKRTVTLQFPVAFHNQSITGEILFFRPSDSEKDIQFPLMPDAEGAQVIQSEKLIKGLYKMKISWALKNKKYYQQKVVVLN
jgi:hypothetical protein